MKDCLMIPSRLLFVVPALTLLAPRSAMAGDVAAAEALFDKGVAELEAGHFDIACPALDESQRLDPQAGTVFTQAECYTGWGKIATASALYGDYLRLFDGMPDAQKKRHEERAQFAGLRRAALKPLIPELTLLMPKDAPPGMRVVRDGMELAAASLGMALPLDPGEHVILVEAPGRAVSTLTVVLNQGDKKTVDLVPGAPPAATPPPPPPGLSAPVTTVKSDARPPAAGTDASAGTWSTGRKVGFYAAGGLGLAGLIAGGITGGVAISTRSLVLEHCVDTRCDHEGKVAADATKGLANASTVAFGMSIAGAAAAAILWLTVPVKRTDPAKAQVGVMELGTAGAVLGVKGAF